MRGLVSRRNRQSPYSHTQGGGLFYEVKFTTRVQVARSAKSMPLFDDFRERCTAQNAIVMFCVPSLFVWASMAFLGVSEGLEFFAETQLVLGCRQRTRIEFYAKGGRPSLQTGGRRDFEELKVVAGQWSGR